MALRRQTVRPVRLEERENHSHGLYRLMGHHRTPLVAKTCFWESKVSGRRQAAGDPELQHSCWRIPFSSRRHGFDIGHGSIFRLRSPIWQRPLGTKTAPKLHHFARFHFTKPLQTKAFRRELHLRDRRNRPQPFGETTASLRIGKRRPPEVAEGYGGLRRVTEGYGGLFASTSPQP